ncbi:MAG TPA: TonB-dependent receptor [Bacteroidota bacterium]|nr:TonB-dependent receptor [Bacteroidota bacterium]
MYRKLLAAVALSFLLPVILVAQDGKLRGRVTDKESGEPLIGANVVIDGTSLGASTDLNGDYIILSIPPGTYTVKASYIGYAPYSIANIRVGSNITTTLDIQLSTTAIQVEAVEIVADRPLIQRNTTNTVRVQTQENLATLPFRGLDNIVALEAGVVEKDGNLYIRGGRAEDVAYFIDGANTTNPYFRSRNINVIQEAIEELQVQAGGYTAEYGGANSGLVRTTLRTGGPEYKVTVDYQTDDFAKPGKSFLGTSSFGYRNAVVTVGGPLVTKDLRFFLAAQHNYERNRQQMFLEPFSFSNLVTDDKGARPAGQPLPGPVEFKRNHLSNNYTMSNQAQGTLLYSFSQFKLKLSGTYEQAEEPRNASWPFALGNYFRLNRSPIATTNRYFGNLKFTHVVSPTTFYEVGVSYQQRSFEQYDKDFKDNWMAYPDSVANAALGYTDWVSRYTGPNPYSTIFQFNFAAPGTPNNVYSRNDQTSIAGSVDFTSQVNPNWELKAGGNLESWVIRIWSISNISNLLRFLDPDQNGTLDKTFSSEYEQRVEWIRKGAINALGYHYSGNFEKVDEGFDKAPRPFMASAYIQNKFEYQDLILNIGARYEYFAPKAVGVPMTPNPTTGQPDWQEPPFDQNLAVLKEDQLTETDPFSFLLPRVSFSFPVTEKTVFYALYGKYAQMPSLNLMYLNNITLSGLFNPLTRVPYNLGGATIGFLVRPERLTQYEIGVRQTLSDNFAFTVTGFYKDTKDQVQIRRIYNSAGVPLTTAYQNEDFGTQKGMELTLELRRTNRLAAKVNYTLSDARGTGSTPRSSQNAVTDEASARFPNFINPLDYNTPHKGSILLDYRWAKGDGGPILEGLGANFVLTFNSGHSYTKIQEPQNLGQASPWNIGVRALIDSRSRVPVEPINASSTPWVFNVDLTLNKVFYLDMFNVEVYARVLNLFNTKHVLNVFPTTGTPHDDGWLKSPYAEPYKQIPGYEEFYRAINLQNRWAYTAVGDIFGSLGEQAGNDIYGTPRQIRVGVKFEM